MNCASTNFIWSRSAAQDKTIKQPPFPEWRFDASAEPARLESEISVFDNSAAGSHTEKITIELYGYHPEKGNREWIESGLKSIQSEPVRTVPAITTSPSGLDEQLMHAHCS